MTTNLTLYELIKNLTPSEKRYFRKFIKGNSSREENQYFQLFEAIAKQKEYDEKKLIKQLNYSTQTNKFAVSKNYLFQQIMKSLRNYHAGDSLFAEILDRMRDFEILYQKKMFPASYRILKKVRKLAEEIENHEILLLVSSWELNLIEHLYEQNEYFKTVDTIVNRIDESSANFRLNTIYMSIFKKIYIHNMIRGFQKTGEDIEAFEQLINHPMVQNYEAATTPLAKIYFHLIQSCYYIGLLQFEDQYIWNKKLFVLFQENPAWQTKYKGLYIQGLAFYFFNQLRLGKFEDFENEIEYLQSIKIESGEYGWQRRKEYEFLNLIFFYAISAGKQEAIFEKYIPTAENYFARNKNLIYSKIELGLASFIAWGYLGMGKKEEALRWANFTDQVTNKNTMLDMHIIMQLVLVLIHFELKNQTIIESLLSSLKRFLSSRKKMTPMLEFVVPFFQKMNMVLHDKSAYKELLKNFKQLVLSMAEQNSKQTLVSHQKFIWWVDAQLQNKTQVEIMKAEKELAKKV